MPFPSQTERRCTLLLVDDHARLRLVLAQVLERSGYRVQHAEHGLAGLEKLRSGEVDIVVLDMDMPIMSGGEFLAARSSDAQLSAVPVVIYSAASRPAPLPKGASTYVWKGAEVADLLAAIAHHGLQTAA